MAGRSMLKTILAYLPALLGERGFAILSIIVFTRMFSPEEYGRYALAISIVLLVDAFVVQWLRLSYLRFYAAAQKSGTLKQLNATSFSMGAVIMISASAVSFFGIQIMDTDPAMKSILIASIFYFAAGIPFKIIAAGARASEKALVYGMMDVGRAFLGFLIAFLLVTFAQFDEEALLYGPAVGFILASIFGGVYLKPDISRDYSPILAKDMMSYGIPLISVFLLTQIMSITDRICLDFFIGSAAVGLYAVGYNLGNHSMMMIYNAINLGVFPMLVKTFENADKETIQKSFTEKVEIIMAITLPASFGLWAAAPNIAYVMTGEDFALEVAGIIPFITFAGLFTGMKLFLFDQVFHLYKKSKQQTLTLIPPVVANVVLNIILIPMMGIQGAIIATLISSVIGLGFSAVMSRAIFTFPMPYMKIGKILFAAIIMWLSLNVFSFSHDIIGLIMMVMVGGVVYGSIAFALNVLNMRRIIFDHFKK